MGYKILEKTARGSKELYVEDDKKNGKHRIVVSYFNRDGYIIPFSEFVCFESGDRLHSIIDTMVKAGSEVKIYCDSGKEVDLRTVTF